MTQFRIKIHPSIQTTSTANYIAISGMTLQTRQLECSDEFNFLQCSHKTTVKMKNVTEAFNSRQHSFQALNRGTDFFTGKSFSEALILVSVNPQYDKRRLFIKFLEKYKLTTCCVQKLFCFLFLF